MNEITITITDKYSMQNYIDNYHYNSHDIKTIVIDKTYDGYLPENMAARNIIIMSKWITKLPKKLTCNYLDISNTSIKEIRSTHIIEDGLRACNMKHDLILPDDMELHYLDLNNSIHFSTIPKNLRVLSYLDVTKTNIKHIPDGTYIGTYLIYNYNSNSYVTIEGAVFNTIERNNLNLYEYCHSLSILS